MTITIDLGDGETAPMTPPPALGAAFAAVVADALFFAGTSADDDAEDAAERISEALADAALDWSCQFGEPDEPPEAGPYIDTLAAAGLDGAAAVAGAVLARDLGLVTEVDFNAVTGWCAPAGLDLPAPRPGATFAADDDAVNDRAEHLQRTRYEVPGWPLAALS